VAGAHPELLRDVAQGRLVEALLLEAALGGVEYLVAREWRWCLPAL